MLFYGKAILKNMTSKLQFTNCFFPQQQPWGTKNFWPNCPKKLCPQTKTYFAKFSPDFSRRSTVLAVIKTWRASSSKYVTAAGEEGLRCTRAKLTFQESSSSTSLFSKGALQHFFFPLEGSVTQTASTMSEPEHTWNIPYGRVFMFTPAHTENRGQNKGSETGRMLKRTKALKGRKCSWTGRRDETADSPSALRMSLYFVHQVSPFHFSGFLGNLTSVA